MPESHAAQGTSWLGVGGKVRFIGLYLWYSVTIPREERSRIAMDYSIVWVRGHVEVYDWAGRFCFSADSEREALEELECVA